jgi:hypothetical protein
MHTRWYSGIKSASINLYNFWQQLRECFMTSVGCVDVSDLIYKFFTRYCFCEEIMKQILSRKTLEGIAQLLPDVVALGLLSNEI